MSHSDVLEIDAPATGLPLAELARELPGAELNGSGEVVVTGVRHDSRKIQPGDLFVARAGAHADGARFIAEARARGARAVLLARGADGGHCLPELRVDDVPRALALAAAAVYGHPTFALSVVGITGTNGKTTTAELVRACIDGCGGRTGVIGTLGFRFGELTQPSAFTSPEADEIARVAAAMRARGASHLVMEVSSIALAAARADAVRFRVAAFTNLTQDHLDYHGTMEAYAAAKARLFTELSPGGAAINVADTFGAKLASGFIPERKLHVPLARYTTESLAGPTEAEVTLRELSHTKDGLDFVARTPAGDVRIRSSMLGLHNVANLLAALSIAWLLELDVASAAEALSTRIQVPGRLERCDEPDQDDVIVLVDYAHTPDALGRALESVRPLTQGRVTCVFGCGGDRDPSKRRLMGEAVARSADRAIVTNDNPRSEDPRAIADAILSGLTSSSSYVVELDRQSAIARAVLGASAGEVVLIAGKGHEPYQIIGKSTLAFDDRVEARRALELRRRARGTPVALSAREEG
jgi:UDP-N-acetylmuramoyl-L-alanyl-D-glutamate--2,6-diaminopimelate ligase